MGRMHSGGKGISSSALPYKRSPPSWLKTTASQVEDQVQKLAKRGLTPSQIGVLLRDQNGIAQVHRTLTLKIVILVMTYVILWLLFFQTQYYPYLYLVVSI